MKYLKSFNSAQEQKQYMANHWFTPYVHMFTNKTLDYEQKYIPVEYIRSTSTGGQYIDTGIGLYDTSPINFRIDMNFMMYGHGKTGTQQSTMLCASKEVSPYPGLNIRTFASTSYYIECIYKEAQKYKDEAQEGTKYRCPMYDVINGTVIYHNWGDTRNYLLYLDREFNFSASQAHNVTTTLFCSKNSSGTPWRFINARLDYCKLYKNGTLVRDFVPCVNTKGIAGLYDKVNKKFYKSEGDEEFVAGPSIL